MHAKVGDFWFYSILLFLAMRAADVLNAFVGLYLVPKYIDPAELGAVMPLGAYASVLVLPVWIFSMAFMKELTTLATQGAFGQMKTLMRGVFICAAIVLVLALVAMRLTLPALLSRVRLAEGSLGFVIVAASFLGCLAPIYSNAMQALKKFREMAILSILGAPVRLVTMLVAMPFRPICGYFIGQNANSVFSIVTSVFCLRKELAIPAEPYWNRAIVRRFGLLLVGMALYHYSSAFSCFVESTVLRQRLPEMDSAAYYMVTRLSDIANFLSSTLLLTLFPYTAELAARGRATRPLVLKASLAMIGFGALLAGVFAVVGGPILSYLPHGEQYAPYAWAIPWLIGISVMLSLQNFHTNTEVSAGRFGFLKWWIPVNVGYPVLMQCVAGYAYFTDVLPAWLLEFLTKHNILSLEAMLWWITGFAVAKLVFCALDLVRQSGEPNHD